MRKRRRSSNGTKPSTPLADDARRGVIVAHYGVAVDVRFDDDSVKSVRVKRRSGHVVGDNVAVADGQLVRLERQTLLSRRDPGGGEQHLAANLHGLGVVSCGKPPPKPGLLERAIVSARAGGIYPFLVVNKIDLDAGQSYAQKVRERYGRQLDILEVSASSSQGTQALAAYVAGHSPVALVGASGVGKSSILNVLAPKATLRIGAISDATGLGKHTTVVATLHQLPSGGSLLDTPGIRDFGLVFIPSLDLAAYFPGFEDALEQGCRFRDCLHIHEPGCCVQAAVTAGEIDAEVHRTYRILLDEILADEANVY